MDRTLTENDVMVIKSLNADLRAVRASLAAEGERVKALEAENEALRKAMGAAREILLTETDWELTNNNMLRAAWEEEAQAAGILTEALQAKEAE